VRILPRIVKLRERAIGACKRTSHRRKSQLYCVGTAKSGTHSIAAMFNDSIRSQHEAESAALIRKIGEIASGLISEADVCRYIRGRDRRLKLDIDSSQLNFFLIDYLLDVFRDARFLLTIRDPYSWLDSFINDSLRRQARQDWVKFREFRFKTDQLDHPPEERLLKSLGLFTLDGYLSYWAMHNHKVVTTIPSSRLFIVKTDEISRRAYEIASFAGLPEKCIRVDGLHSFKNPQKFNILDQLDRDYLEAKVREHGGWLMQQFFPEIQSAQDAGIAVRSGIMELRTPLAQ
jgi:hypothetical protein